MLKSLEIALLLLHSVLIGASVSPPIHERCIINGHRTGACRDSTDCPVEIFVREGLIPKYCDDTPNSKLCCPLADLTEVVVGATRPDCGIKGVVDASHFGYTLAGLNEWPWMALLVRRKRSNPLDVEMYCNGVLINDQYVLSTAGCVLFDDSFYVLFGEHNTASVSEGAATVGAAVETRLIHPLHRPDFGYNDLALIKLTEKIRITPDVSPICLPERTIAPSANMIGRQGTTTGWTLDKRSDTLLPLLTETETEVFHAAVCNHVNSAHQGFNSVYPQGIDTDSVLCAGHVLEEETFCQNTEGAPFVYQDSINGKWVLGGINAGVGCGLKLDPGIYNSIGNVATLSWILENSV